MLEENSVPEVPKIVNKVIAPENQEMLKKIDTLSTRLADLEKENLDLKNKQVVTDNKEKPDSRGEQATAQTVTEDKKVSDSKEDDSKTLEELAKELKEIKEKQAAISIGLNVADKSIPKEAPKSIRECVTQSVEEAFKKVGG